MRLIDADEYVEFCEQHWIPLNVDAVKDQPTIDLTRCQECKYYEAGRENEPDYCSRHSEWVRRDFFCGDAEREKMDEVVE